MTFMGRSTQRAKQERQRASSARNSGLVVALTLAVASVAWQLNNYLGRPEPSPPAITHRTTALDQARTNSAVRQSYLDNLLTNSQIPNCTGVVYDHDGTKIISYLESELARMGVKKTDKEFEEYRGAFEMYRKTFLGGKFDAQTPEIVEQSEIGEKSPIFVGRDLFEKYPYLNDADIRTILTVHEKTHVSQHANGLGYIKRDEILAVGETGRLRAETLYAIFELDAVAAELKATLQNPSIHSKEYIATTKKMFMGYTFSLVKASKEVPEKQRDMIIRVLENVGGENLLRNVSLQ